MTRVAALLAAALFLGCGPPAVIDHPPFTVHDGFIRDSDGRAVILRGVNLSGEQKHPPFFDFQQAPDYRQVSHDWGMNGIRFLVSWAALEPSPGRYDETYVAGIKERMDWAHDAGLLVVIDMHQDLYGLGFPVGNGAPAWTCDASHYASFAQTYTPSDDWFLAYLNPDIIACYDHFWRSDDLWTSYANAVAHLAHALADKPAVLGVDLMNEPYWGSALVEKFESQDLQPFYERIIPTIRAQAPHWLIFAEPASSRNLGVATGLTALPFDNVVYAPHSYDSNAERGNGFLAADRATVVDNMTKLGAEAKALHAALWVGEYGGMADKPGIADYMDAEYDAAAAVAASTMCWDDDKAGEYGLLNPDGSEKPEYVAALVRPFPERVVGTPVSYGYDEATRTFTLTRIPPKDEGDATTDISVPARVYPDGVDVACNGCTSLLADQVLHLTHLAGARDVVVTPRAP